MTPVRLEADGPLAVLTSDNPLAPVFRRVASS